MLKKEMFAAGARLLPNDVQDTCDWGAAKIVPLLRPAYCRGFTNGYLDTYQPDAEGPDAVAYRAGYDAGCRERELLTSLGLYRKPEWTTPELRRIA